MIETDYEYWIEHFPDRVPPASTVQRRRIGCAVEEVASCPTREAAVAAHRLLSGDPPLVLRVWVP